MSGVRIVPVDERDSGWEDHRPRFRVYLQGDGRPSTGGRTATYDVTGADVLQVIDWAQTQAGDGQTYAVALVRDDVTRASSDPSDRRGLVWLVGMDGNDRGAGNALVAATQQRMVARRTAPVVVPPADKMPHGVAAAGTDGGRRDDG